MKQCYPTYKLSVHDQITPSFNEHVPHQVHLKTTFLWQKERRALKNMVFKHITFQLLLPSVGEHRESQYGRPYHYDLVFLLVFLGKNEQIHYSQLQLVGSHFDSDVSSNMAIIGKINIWNIGLACRHVGELTLCEGSVRLPRERSRTLWCYNISSAHITRSDHQRADLSSYLKQASLYITIYLFNLLIPKCNQDMVWSSVNMQTDVLCTE